MNNSDPISDDRSDKAMAILIAKFFDDYKSMKKHKDSNAALKSARGKLCSGF